MADQEAVRENQEIVNRVSIDILTLNLTSKMGSKYDYFTDTFQETNEYDDELALNRYIWLKSSQPTYTNERKGKLKRHLKDVNCK